MRTLVLLFSVIVASLAAASYPAGGQSAIILEPEVVIEEFYAFPHEGSANKLSSAYTYPEVRYIDAYLRIEVGGFVGERKATAFVTMSCEDDVLAKRKEKLKLKAGRYEVTFPKMLDLRKVFGERKIKLFIELALEGVPEITQEYFFLVAGRELPRVEVLDFQLYPGRMSESGYFAPGEPVDAEVVFALEKSGDAPLTIRVVGVMEDENDFSIDPRDDYQEHDVCWDETRIPRRDDTYLLTFKAYLPRYFYDYGAGRHPFTIYVLFLAEDQIIKMVSYREFIIDYYPGMERDSEEEALRAIQIERAYGWRVRPLEYAFDDERHRQRGWSDDY